MVEVTPIERRLRTTEGAVDQHEQRIGKAERSLEVQHDELIRAKSAFAKMNELVQAVLAGRDDEEPPPPPFSWLTAADPTAAEIHLVELEKWTNRVLIHFPGGRLADCWRRHPNVVEELFVLKEGHDLAWALRGAVASRFDWLNRWLPETVKRIQAACGKCSLGQHVSQEPFVPAIQSHIDQIDVGHWIQHHGTRPEIPPTAASVHEAEARKLDGIRTSKTRTR